MNVYNCCFENPMADYNPEAASKIIDSNGNIKKDCRIFTTFKKKWQTTMNQIKNPLDSNCSIYLGIGGMALLKFKLDHDSRGSLLEIKDLLILNINNIDNKNNPTFLFGTIGPLALLAIISFKLNQRNDYFNTIKSIETIGNDYCLTTNLTNELFNGRAGYLYALLYVNKYCSPPPFHDSLIRKIIEIILISGQEQSKIEKFINCPLMYHYDNVKYLGIAHGLAGILYILLQANNYLNNIELITLIKPTIDYLTTLKLQSGNYPIALGVNKDFKVQWCHGATGFVFLYCQAYKIFNDENYLKLAEECSDIVWKWGLLKKGYSLCHGVAGNGYTFLEIYKITKNLKYLYRACRFADWCIEYTKFNEQQKPEHPLSLFEGVCGRMYFLLDIQDPLEAKFPGFTL